MRSSLTSLWLAFTLILTSVLASSEITEMTHYASSVEGVSVKLATEK